MKIGFIGAGRVSSAFGRFLKEKNINVEGYCSKSFESAKKAAEFTSSNAYSSLEDLVSCCNYIFITTPDDEIKNVYNKIKQFNLQDKKIFHMSGSISSKIFDDIETFGAYGYSLHPIFPFPDKEVYKKLNQAYFTIEGDNIALIRPFLEKLTIRYFEIPSDSKEKYHAAMVFASNYIVALSKISKNLLIECNIQEDLISSAIYPLMLSAVENINQNGVEKALTGPIVRGDIGTIEKHLKNIDGYKDIYCMLGKVATSIAKENGNIDEETAHMILKKFEEELKWEKQLHILEIVKKQVKS